ncbi:MAG TPA: glycoside hydrolase family 15 protein [Pirellulales bacterium]|nr:glycoside hydrolase family 15 protein [Pirellulales bacterium]
MSQPTRGPAFGSPGIEPRWTRSDKDAVGTAYSASSRIWFTLAAGIVSEVYYPTIDRPQIRDLQFLVTDGRTFFHDERRHTTAEVEQLSPFALGYRVTNTSNDPPYRIVKQIISDPHYASLLIETRLEGDPQLLDQLQLYVLLAPHLQGGGKGNSGRLAEVAGQDILLAYKESRWLALGASVPLVRRSCGYVGASDGWTDLAQNYALDWEFDSAPDGNIALVAQIDPAQQREFTLGLALGDSLHDVQTTLLQSLGVPFADHRERFLEQWARVCRHTRLLAAWSGDDGALYRRSHSLLLAHEDKGFPGAMIASLSIPWGESKGDEDLGGYHLVWPRDLVHSATALLACGSTATAYRSLIYLACCQSPDGGFYQSFWIDGQPYWTGVQLDQVSFAILLAWRLQQAGALRDFDCYPMVRRAAAFLLEHGPGTAQERWEENSGYSPSTLAANIAAISCAAIMADKRGDAAISQYLWEYADFLEANVDRWTVTTSGTLVPGIPRHYVRILPVAIDQPDAPEDLQQARLVIKNRPPGAAYEFPAKDVVDAGFLELVRYGIRKAGDPLMEDSLAVIDRVLRVETPFGPSWRRYNHDGYGQREDGGPYLGWGRGRAWPLLTGERGHYELAAGRDPGPYLRTLERFANGSLLAEQVWDEADRPDSRLFLGRPTGAAMPLVWAHAEYLTLLRSTADGQVFDFLPHLAARYQARQGCKKLEIWKPNRHVRSICPGWTLRVQAPEPFQLRWTANEWQDIRQDESIATGLGVHYFDLFIPPGQSAPQRFTFYWPNKSRWEGRDYTVNLRGSC